MGEGAVKLSYLPEYNVWSHMRSRCNNPKNKDYDRYGGRGISVCDRWADFSTFLSDMGRRPSRKHTIERKDNDRGYFPENCRWATRAEQALNTSKNLRLNYSGRVMTASQWEKELGLPEGIISERRRARKSGKELFKPAARCQQRKVPKICINGIVKTVQEWAKYSGIPATTLYRRLKDGRPHDRLIEPVRRCIPFDKTFFTIGGVSKSLPEWSRESGISLEILYARAFTYRWSSERLLDPIRKINK